MRLLETLCCHRNFQRWLAKGRYTVGQLGHKSERTTDKKAV